MHASRNAKERELAPRTPGPGRAVACVRSLAPRVRALLAGSCILAAIAAAPAPLDAQASMDAKRIIISLDEYRLWLVQGPDTLLDAAVAIGRRESFEYGGQRFDWRTPRGERSVLAKRRDPVWTVPEWHYYARAADEHLDLVRLARGSEYPLADGSRLAVRGPDVVRVLGDRFWVVPTGREIIVDGVLFMPPLGTRQRQVPDALGTRALDMGEGYLIHGTTPYNSGSIGSAASHGCVRMRTADVERLFELVDAGTVVLIE